ncbi:MAG: PAS domain S-box protein [Magnetococcales bacterium]|nr:PAS domain S-box protein [Magnetococcales bacterium]
MLDKMGLVPKILLYMGGGATLIFFSLLFFYSEYQKQSILAENERAGMELAGTAIHGLRSVMLTGNARIAQNYAQHLKNVEDIQSLEILRPDGLEAFQDNKTIDSINWRLGKEAFPYKNVETTVTIIKPDDPNMLKVKNSREAIFYYSSNSDGKPFLTFLVPILATSGCKHCHGWNDDILGLVRISTSLDATFKAIDSTHIYIAKLSVTSLLLLLLFTYLFIKRGIERPLKNVRNVILKIEEGDLDQRIPDLDCREFTNLTKSFNMMVGRLQDTYVSVKNSESRLRAVMENVADGILTTDEDGTIKSINKAALWIFNCSADEIIGKNVEILVPEPHRSSHRDYIKKYTKWHNEQIFGKLSGDYHGEIFFEREISTNRLDGKPVLLEVTVTHIINGNNVNYIATIRDITKKKIAEKELEETRQKNFQQDKMAAVGTLAAGIVHEIGNPLTAMTGLIEGFQDFAGPFTADDQANLDLIRDQVDRMASIVRDVSDLASPQSEEYQLLNVNDVIESSCRLMRFHKRLKQIPPKLILNRDISMTFGSTSQLRQVIINLLINAADATAELYDRKPQISVASSMENNRIVITIADNGSGMSQDVAKRAFEAFFTTKPLGKGTGLGLALCYSIVDHHKGEIVIETELEKGSKFHIYLPSSDILE